jgi:hypothetical protein
MVLIRRLVREDVQCGATELSGFERPHQGVLVDQCGARGVHQKCTLGHEGQLTRAYQSGCGWGQRHVQGDRHARAEQLVQGGRPSSRG